MTEFHVEDPDLKNSTLEWDFQVVRLKRTTSDSQGKRIRTETKNLFKPKFGNKGHIRVVVAVAVLGAKGPYWLRCCF